MGDLVNFKGEKPRNILIAPCCAGDESDAIMSRRQS